MAYRRIFATPHVLALTVPSVVARLPVGMTALAFVIFVHDRTGSFGSAGLVAGAGTVGLAATAPVLGRLVDRRGPRPVLVPAAAVAAAALVAAVALGEAGAGTAAPHSAGPSAPRSRSARRWARSSTAPRPSASAAPPRPASASRSSSR